MCGIVGVKAFDRNSLEYENYLNAAIQKLSKRGPDSNGKYFHNQVALGHTRLSIIDISDAACQPMTDHSGRYVIVFNGEIYNYQELKKDLISRNVKFCSESDTEVLLNLYIHEGANCLQKINGFFAFAIYDKKKESVFIARDRIGIKPLLIYQDSEKIIFASEMKAILCFNVDKTIDDASLKLYVQLNYIPSPSSVFTHVKKLKAGHYVTINKEGLAEYHQYYQIPPPRQELNESISYNEAKNMLKELLCQSVKRRLIADVPLGAFLSGGIDSSIIVALASTYTEKLNTFSIGYKDEPFFDETAYANLVAKKFNTNHTVFSLANKDLFDHLFEILDYLDEPFADSSAIAVYILSRQTRTKVTVALSGDGADEMFAGYNKHLAEYRARSKNFVNAMLKWNQPILQMLPKSRNSRLGNFNRQLNRYAQGLKLNNKERYWRWCSFIEEKEADQYFTNAHGSIGSDYLDRKTELLTAINGKAGLNDFLYTDMHLVLQNDMLTKVDSMSMANSLEVRVPFLDHELVNFVCSLPSEFKISKGFRKKILKDTFREILPEPLYHRNKQGFEVPLLKWFRNELKPLITDDLLDTNFIEKQGLFNADYINAVKAKLFSSNPEEVHAQIWALIVFQYWWKKYIA